MKNRYFIKIFILVLSLFLLTNVIYANNNKKIATESVFNKEGQINVVELLVNESIQTIIMLYNQGKIGDRFISNYLNYVRDLAIKRNNLNSFFKFQAGLMMQIHYPHLGEIESVSILSGGVMFIKPVKITTKDGNQYVFKFMGNGNNKAWKDDEESIKLRVEINNFLYNKGIPFPKIYKKNIIEVNDYIVKIKEGNYILMDFIDKGSILDVRNVEDKHHSNLGKIIAQMQNALGNDERFSRIPPESEDIYLNAWIDFMHSKIGEVSKKNTNMQRQNTHIRKIYGLYYEMLQDQYKLFNRNYDPNTQLINYEFIHTDLHPLNVLYAEEEVVGIVDIERITKVSRIREFLSPMQARVLPQRGKCQFSITYSLENFTAMLSSFQANLDKPLTQDEIRGIIEILRMHFIRDSIGYLLEIHPAIDLSKTPNNYDKVVEFFEKFKQFTKSFSNEQDIALFIKEINVLANLKKQMFKNNHLLNNRLKELGIERLESLKSFVFEILLRLSKKSEKKDLEELDMIKTRPICKAV